MKKKKFKFRVTLKIEELSSIPLLNGVLFCKARLTSGGDFSELTSRESIVSHCVRWSSNFDFPCKLSASLTTGTLETCLCRVSVRKEVKGGKSHDKVGYVDINLAEYAGAGNVTRHYILEGYHDDKKHRQDNSILKISASMKLTSGDLLFKPQVSPSDQLTVGSVDSVKPSSSDSFISAGAYSTPRNSDDLDTMKRAQSDTISMSMPLAGSPSHHHHKRNISSGSNVFHTRNPSGGENRYSLTQPLSHSRQSSGTTADSACADLDMCNVQSPIQRNKQTSHRRINETRVNADDIIDQLIQGTDLTLDSSNTDEGIELSLFLEDGASTMSKIETKRRDRGTNPYPPDHGDRFKTL